jgi:hypothetical protein
MVISMVGNVAGFAALHIVGSAVPERPTVNEPAVIRFGWPGRFWAPTYQQP